MARVSAAAAVKIVIPGGSGQVGTALARYFHTSGHAVTVLSRVPHKSEWRTAVWDGVRKDAWIAELEGSNVCINLAGRSVNCRYGASNRRAILESRTKSTALLGEVMEQLTDPPRVWLNASTATIYRHALDRPMDEAAGELGGNEAGAPDTWNFSIDVARAWEKAFYATELKRTRKVALRSAMTFTPDRGGVFDVLLRLVRLGFGGQQGPSTQYISWIHEADFIRAVEFLIARDDLSGVVNLASPNPLSNREFMMELRRAWGKRLGLHIPEWMLEIGAFLIRTESELILKSRRVVPGRLREAGFEFRYPLWPDAARELVTRWKQLHTRR